MSTKWSPQIVFAQKQVMTHCLDGIEEQNEALLASLAVYSRVMNDNVQETAQKTVKVVHSLVEEMRRTIEEKLGHLERGARLQTAIEEDAASKFR